MSWNQRDEQTKVAEIERWDQHIFKPHRWPTPSYLEHENMAQLQKRLINRVRPLVSEELQKVKTDDLFNSSLTHVAQQFFESAANEAIRPTKVPEGQLREVVSYDAAGRPSSSFYGSPRAWLNQFCSTPKRLAGIMHKGAHNETF